MYPPVKPQQPQQKSQQELQPTTEFLLQDNPISDSLIGFTFNNVYYCIEKEKTLEGFKPPLGHVFKFMSPHGLVAASITGAVAMKLGVKVVVEHQGDISQEVKKRKLGQTIQKISPPAIDDKSTFIDVNHFLFAGLLAPNARRLYVRKEWLYLWEKLTSETNIILNGPPGTGKSALVWTYALQASFPVCWVHVSSVLMCVAEIREDKISEWSDSATEINNFLYSSSFDGFKLLIIDGVSKKTMDMVISRVYGWNIRVILVTSQQVFLKPEALKEANIQVLNSYGWTFDEYLTASKDAQFYNSIQQNLDTPSVLDRTTADDNENDDDGNSADDEKKNKLELKFYIAGHSARWMFFYKTSDVLKFISDAMKKVVDAKSYIGNNVGISSPQVVNTLVTEFQREDKSTYSSIVSDHVTKLLAQRGEAEFLIAATNYAITAGNGSLSGWIFQYDILYHIDLLKPLEYQTAEGTGSWLVNEKSEFAIVEDLAKLKADRLDGCWLVPLNPCQGGYDLLQLSKIPEKPENWILRKIQITVARSHELKLRFAADAVTHLANANIKVVKVEVYFLVPLDVLPKFTVGTITGGGLNVWKTVHLDKDPKIVGRRRINNK